VSDQPIKVYPNDATDPSRDPYAVINLASRQWCDWHPGDGSRYRVHIETIRGGSDDADRVLLLNIQRHTIAFQWAPAAYRHDEGERWTKKRCKQLGMPGWAWHAARPLLEAVGATRKRNTRNPYASLGTDERPARPVTTVHLPDTEEPA
jgi:hypothetical protein